MSVADQPGDDALSDDALMLAYAAGDGAAFERLYQRHRAALYRFVCRLLGPLAATQADEVFQDTWLRAIQARHDWSPQGASLRTWLFTLAHHRAVDCLRKSGREVSAVLTDDDGDEPWTPAAAAWRDWPDPRSGDPANGLFWRRAGQKLLDCLQGLPLAQRTAFLLQHEEGLAVEHIALALGVGFETAKTRLRYAMSKLRACMGAYLPPEGAGSP